MNLLQRYRRLTCWNKVFVLGAIASILTLVLYLVPRRQGDEVEQITTVDQSPGTTILQSARDINIHPSTASTSQSPPSVSVTATGAVVALGDIDVGGDINVYQGLSNEQVQQIVKQIREGIESDKLKQLSEDLNITQTALLKFFRLLDEKEVPLEELASKLQEIAERYKTLEADLSAFRSDDPEVNKLKGQAAQALTDGEFEKAEELLENAEEREVEAAKKYRLLQTNIY